MCRSTPCQRNPIQEPGLLARLRLRVFGWAKRVGWRGRGHRKAPHGLWFKIPTIPSYSPGVCISCQYQLVCVRQCWKMSLRWSQINIELHSIFHWTYTTPSSIRTCNRAHIQYVWSRAITNLALVFSQGLIPKKSPAATFASGANLRAACKDGNLRSLQCRGELVVSEMMIWPNDL